MKLKFLGTCAAEGIPALFCDCAVCQHVRIHGGRDVRTRSQALIDDRILLDFGPDTLLHCLREKLDISHLEHCLITHVHEDHLDVTNVMYRQKGFANLQEGSLPLTVWGSAELGEVLHAKENGGCNRDDSVLFRHIPPLTPAVLQDSVAGEYEVIAIPAVHSTREPYNYIIRSQRENKALLYAHDTSIYEQQSTWDYMTEQGIHLDLVSLDCTFANDPRDFLRGHMSFVMVHRMRDRLLELGVADERTVFVANHFSHNGPNVLYEEMCQPSVSDGMVISYDGMEIEF